ncbi:MAG: deoxyribose-phosphate aldolase [Flavobacteriaceae bacterium]|nr:deoxyribose-phosphate aldolase [Bacteroidia bacterium]NNK83856.1 deoxyribose-phosphate aldolase [Flavobacteriaceae bacterium]
MKSLNKYIDHTLLKPTATESDIILLCEEAKQYNFFSVCINSCFVKLAKIILKDSSVKVCTVVGFPLGAMETTSKAFEAKTAIENGADEIDMVINIGFLKSRDYDAVLNDISAVKKATGNKTLKVILETCDLTKDEIIKACELCVEAKADFVKTSTGFSQGGAQLADVKIMKKTVKDKAKIKASGGIRDYETAMHFVDLGVDRLGVSAGVAIMNGERSNSDY